MPALTNKCRRALTVALMMSMSALSLTSCYDNREAKALVKEFLDNNLKNENYTAEYFSKVDSTFVISDSVLNDIQQKAHASGLFKPLKFGERGNSRRLNFIKVRYVTGNDTIKQTFYFDEKTTRVVGVKRDF